jgi:hypothetical protein
VSYVPHPTTCRHIILSVLALTMSACQTIEDSSAVGPWSTGPAARIEDRQPRSPAALGAPLVPDRPVRQPILIEGTGSFVADRGSPAMQVAVDAGEDRMTLNLVNVPAAQAAKTVLGDILGVNMLSIPRLKARSRSRRRTRSRSQRSSIFFNRHSGPTMRPSLMRAARTRSYQSIWRRWERFLRLATRRNRAPGLVQLCS